MKFCGAAGSCTNRLLASLLSVLVAISVNLTGCREHASNPEPRLAEPYAPADGVVGLDILPLHDANGSRAWLATYTDERGTTKFRIELSPSSNPAEKDVSMSFGKGRFLGEAGSDPIPLLESLKRALQAKRMPTKVKKTEALPFDYVVLGENQTRLPGGGFADKPKGDWIAMKVFLAQGENEGEVFLNINGTAHKAEFSIKDSDYGDIVLEELAKVL